MDSLPGSPATIDSRAAALAIDISVYALLAVLLVAIGDAPQAPQDPYLRWGVSVGLTLVFWIGLAYRWNSPGKWFVGLRLADGDGRTPGIEQCLKRSFFPGVVWVGAFLARPGSDWIDQARRDEPSLLLGYLILSPILWIVTAKLVVPPNRCTFYNDRISGTSFVRCPGHVWFLTLVAEMAREGASFVKEWAIESAKATHEWTSESAKATYEWADETMKPWWLDVRRAAAWVIDIILLLIAYAVLEDGQGPFAQSGSWYFVFLSIAALILWVMPARGYSPGKVLFELRIVNAHGRPPGMRAALVRTLVPGTIWIVLLLLAPQRELLPAANWIEVLLWGALAFSIFVAIMDLVDPDQRAIHNLAAGTYVIDPFRGFGANGYPGRLQDDVHWRLVSNKPDVKAQVAGEKSERSVKPARRRRRAVGFLIDFVVALTCLNIVAALLPGYANHFARLLAQGAVLIGYFVGLVALWGTPGSWLSGVKVVVAQNGRTPGFARALARLLPYAPLFILPLFDTSFLSYHFESNELVMMAWDLVLLWLLIVLTIDAIAFVRRGEAVHNRIAGTTVTRSAAESRRAALGTWIVEKWRWLNGDEPEWTFTLTRPRALTP